MIGASLYILGCSARNRLRVRLRRLREPRYLLGAAAGAAYLYFTVFGRMRSSGFRAARPRTRNAPELPAALASLVAAGPQLSGLALLAVSAASWLLPFNSGLLEFSEAEVAFLFPAPVSRRALLAHRLIRSQLGLLFGGIVIGIASPMPTGSGRLRVTIAMWMLLLCGKVYFTGATLARARLGAAGPRARRLARAPLMFEIAALLLAAQALVRAFARRPVAGLSDAVGRIAQTAGTGVTAVVLWPFTALTRPLFAVWPGPYLAALASAGVVLAALVAWVMESDDAFQDAATEIVERRERRGAAQAPRFRVRGSLSLGVVGRPETAFAWKAALQTFRVVDRRSLVRLLAIVAALSIMAVSVGRARGLADVLGVFAAFGAAFAVMMGPQALRLDLRQDLQHLELLKTWPVPAAAVVRGEIAWPGALATLIAWACIGLALFLSQGMFATTSLGWRVSAAAAGAVLAPALVFAQYAIQNGVALMFPAWVPLGSQRARGLDAMGQRLILLGGTWLLLAVMLLPGAMAGGIVWFALYRFLGAAAVVAGALACALVVGAEVLVATEALGPAYERLDLTAVEKAE